MKSAPPMNVNAPGASFPTVRQVRAAGFTLLEVMLAVFIFGMAAVALVEAINTSGRTSLDARMKGRIQMRLDNLLLEATRDPLWAADTRVQLATERVVEENGVRYLIKREPLDLKNVDGQPLQGLYLVQITARWMEGSREQRAVAETWAYPLMFRPPNMRQGQTP
jgi:prepilin-type N-terminal cleavage/methylation domain-containing protein